MLPFLHRATPTTMEENPLWLVVLADMMTNLMLFFLVLFALTRQNLATQKLAERVFAAEELIDTRHPSEEAARFQEEKSIAALRELFEDVSETERQVRVRLKDRILFATGKASLSPESARTLEALARILNQMPNEVVVEGHTDDAPIVGGPYRTNWELSVARSYSVIEGLIRSGVDAKRLVTSGYGPHHPLVPNDGPTGRARNRRVEIVILRPDADG